MRSAALVGFRVPPARHADDNPLPAPRNPAVAVKPGRALSTTATTLQVARGRSAMGLDDSRTGLTPAAFEARVLGFLGLGIVALGLVFCLSPIPQDLSYHTFADDRTMLGVPNFLNVASNLPFIVVGVLG